MELTLWETRVTLSFKSEFACVKVASSVHESFVHETFVQETLIPGMSLSGEGH